MVANASTRDYNVVFFQMYHMSSCIFQNSQVQLFGMHDMLPRMMPCMFPTLVVAMSQGLTFACERVVGVLSGEQEGHGGQESVKRVTNFENQQIRGSLLCLS